MSDQEDAKAIALKLLAEGQAVDDVISALSNEANFERLCFYETKGYLYLADDDGRFEPMKVCEIPERLSRTKELLGEPVVVEKPISVLEYAANWVHGDSRRGIFIRAFVEGEAWAIADFKAWKEGHKDNGEA